MKQRKLTRTLIARLKPREQAYDILDTEQPGLGVRVYPSGRKRFFMQTRNRARRKWQGIGEAETLGVAEARKLVRGKSGVDKDVPPLSTEPVLFESVGKTLLDHYARHWKPRTRKTNFRHFEDDILPFFTGTVIAEIDALMVRRWFASLGNRPGQANRALPVLSVLIRQAEDYGYRPSGTNPCKGISRYKMLPKERFLNAEELARLENALDTYGTNAPLIAAYFRLLILTGCRKGEIAALEWKDYRHGRLYPPDSKTGAKTVFLSSAARAVLDGLPRTSPRVFGKGWSAAAIAQYWWAIRAKANLDDVRIHDLRHTYASTALAQGKHILTIGKLLGHRDPETTFKYAHLADAHIRKTARAVSAAIAKGM